MNQNELEKYKSELLEQIKEEIIETGELTTFLEIYSYDGDDPKPKIVHVVTPFGDEEDKLTFVKHGIPAICDKLKSHNLKPECIAFVSEAKMHIVDTKNDKKETKEIIIINLSTKKEDNIIIYNVVSGNYEVDENGDLKEKIELVEEKDLNAEESESDKNGVPRKAKSGLFTNLYSKFENNLK